MGFVGERKALAAAILAFYMLLYLIAALLGPPGDGFRPFLSAMGLLYGTAFFALVAGYFWARWFAIGLGIYGLILGVMAVWQVGPVPEILFLGGTHGLISLALWGDKVATHYDGRTEWRSRFHMDENATRRLGKAVIRVGISLPILIAYGLAPRDSMVDTLVCAAAVGLVGVGVWGFLRLRTWGLVVMICGAAAVLGTIGITEQLVALGRNTALDLSLNGTLGAVVLLLAALPFAGPIARYVRS